MPRRPIAILPGIPHHITQRAAHGKRILESPAAKAILASLLADWAAKTGVIVDAFVFLNNHFHLCATPPDEQALARMVGNAAQGLSRWLNVSTGQAGPNWQRRFFAAPMDEEYAVAAVRYIERNPVAAGLVEVPWDWHWSSASCHAGLGPKPRLLAHERAPGGFTARAWREELRGAVSPRMCDAIHLAANSNRPLADEAWIERLEATLGRRIRPLPRGRPRSAGAPGDHRERKIGK